MLHATQVALKRGRSRTKSCWRRSQKRLQGWSLYINLTPILNTSKLIESFKQFIATRGRLNIFWQCNANWSKTALNDEMFKFVRKNRIYSQFKSMEDTWGQGFLKVGIYYEWSQKLSAIFTKLTLSPFRHTHRLHATEGTHLNRQHMWPWNICGELG